MIVTGSLLPPWGSQGLNSGLLSLPASVINTWAIIVDLVMSPYNCHLIQSEITFKGIFDKGLCRLGWLWAYLWGKRHLGYVKWDLKTRQLWVTPFLGILSWRRRVEIGGSVLVCRYSFIASCSWLWIWDELLLQIPASLTSLQVWTDFFASMNYSLEFWANSTFSHWSCFYQGIFSE